MVWSILAAIPLLALLALWLFRFRYHLEYESPDALRVVAGVHFLWWKKILTAEPLRFFGADAPHGEGAAPASGPGRNPFGPDAPDAWAGQRGALSLPDAWVTWFGRGRERFRRAGLKWLLDPGVWRLLAAFAWRSSRRVLRMARPRLDSLHIGLENAYDLARLASAWSVAQATLPALACPVSYGFGARKAEIRVRLGGRFTALDAVILVLLSMTTFPFGALLRRFAHCWREPELSGWQKRVLLP